MDFLEFFGLKEEPFRLTPDPAYYFPSASHNEGLLLMDYSIDQKEGFLLVIGNPGTGKTTLLKVFLERWKSRAETAIILTPRLSPEECLISIAEDFKINLENKNKNEIIKALRDFMTAKSQEDKRVIIIVDEAQNLPDETLEELRLLSNLETDKDKLIQIILLGQPELEEKLKSDRLRQLNQRISTRIHLRNFGYSETMDYIDYRVITGGAKKLQITKKVGKLIYKLSNGTPRLINMIVSRTLMAAYLEESTLILPRHLHNATKSLNHSDIKIKKPQRLAPVAAAVALLIFVVSASAYFYIQKKNTNIPSELITSQSEQGPGTLADADPVTDQPDQEQIIPDAEENAADFGGSDPVPDELYEEDIQEEVVENEENPIPDEMYEEDIEEEVVENEGNPVPDDDRMPDIELVSVKVPVANIRKTPSVDSEKIGHTFMYNQFLVLNKFKDAQNTKWYLVPFQGKKGWISGWIVEMVDIKEMFKEDSELTESVDLPETDISNQGLPVLEDFDSNSDQSDTALHEARAEPDNSLSRGDLQGPAE